MASIDYYSATSSTISGTSSVGLPRSRIKCSKDQITVGGSSFQSASEALLVYLQQYDVSADRIKGQVSGHKGNETLLLEQYLDVSNQKLSSKSLPGTDPMISGSSSNMTRVKAVDSLLTSKLYEDVTDTLREVRLQRLLKQAAQKSQKLAKTELQREVEAALLRSGQLLEKVTKEDISPSEILTNDANSAPANLVKNDFLLSAKGEGRSGHIYSYRTSRPQKSYNHSLSTSVHAPMSYPRQSRELRRSTSTDSLVPAPYGLPPRSKRSLSSSLTSLSNQSDPTDVLRIDHSQSLSHGLRTSAGLVTSKGEQKTEHQCVIKSVPSWVGEISPSEVSISIWNSEAVPEVKNDRKPFIVSSLAGEMDDSKIITESQTYETSVLPRISISPIAHNGSDRYYSNTDIDLDNTSGITSDSRPGLNFSDLAISGPHSFNSNKQVIFMNGVGKEDSCSEKCQPKHSVPAQTNRNQGYSDTLLNPQSRMLDSEYNGEEFLHNSILPQTARLKKSMDNFVASSENLRDQPLSSGSSVATSGPLCSSLDTLSLLTGQPLLRKDVLASTSETRHHNMAKQINNHQDRGSSPTNVGQDQSSTDELDGDRPWEKVTGTFKAPVPVDCEDLPGRDNIPTEKNPERTLSGRKQPGSMETLKNMLFKLQAEENSTQEGSSKNEEPSSNSQLKSYADIIPALQNYDFQKEPGGQSLEKALVHLNRLKQLVQSTSPSGSSHETVGTTPTTELPKEN